MTKLYFIRHGKTEWNAEGRFQGAGGDSPLLPESYDQIKMLGRHLHDVKFAHAFASSIKRARITAEETLALLDEKPGANVYGWIEGVSFASGQARRLRMSKLAGMTCTMLRAITQKSLTPRRCQGRNHLKVCKHVSARQSKQR